MGVVLAAVGAGVVVDDTGVVALVVVDVVVVGVAVVVVVAGVAVVVVVPVEVVLVLAVPPDEDASVVVTVPLEAVVTTFAEVRLPAESIVYCAVPVPPPQADRMNGTLLAASSARGCIALLLRVNCFIKILSID